MRTLTIAAALLLGISIAYAEGTRIQPPADGALRFVAPSPVLNERPMELAARLKELARETARLEAEIAKTSWPFPQSIEAIDQPAVLLPKLLVAAAHFGDQIAFHTVDCSEYPCLYFGVAGHENPKDFWTHVPGASELKSRSTEQSHRRVGDCGAFFAVTTYAGPHLDILGKRITARIDAFAPKTCKELYWKP